MLGIKLRETCEILNKPLRLLCGPQDPYHVVAIKRGNDTIIPGGNDELRLYDIVYFMTTTNYIAYIRKKLAGIGANLVVKSLRNAGYTLEIV